MLSSWSTVYLGELQMDQDVPEVLDHGEEVEPIQEMYMESGQEVYAETGQ